MRIRRQPAAGCKLLAEILQLRFINPAFHVGARIHTGRGVTLEINHVARKIFGATPEKMILRHFVKRRGRRKRRDVATDVRIGIRLHHHRHCIPAHDTLDAALDVAVAGILRLLLGRNRVDVGRRLASRRARRGAKLFRELFQQLRRAFRALILQRQFENRLHRIRPFVAVSRGGSAADTGTVNIFFRGFHWDKIVMRTRK